MSAGARLWAVAAYFNPAGSARRLANYRAFRRALRVPLATVELAFGPGFELGPGDADLLLQHRGRDVMWQKERLLNLALAALPPACEAVAWLDADIAFARPDWPGLTLAALEQHALVQPFNAVHDATATVDAADAASWGGPTRRSLASVLATGEMAAAQVATARIATDWRCAVGLAWAARRELLERHGLYDAAIVGGGDRAILCAALGAWDGLAGRNALNARQLDHYRAWAEPFFASVGGKIGCAGGALLNMVHGSRGRRAYAERHAGLSRFGFDPAVDLALDEAGFWRWGSDRPGLHAYVRDYLLERGD
jgi:hypothetical protein